MLNSDKLKRKADIGCRTHAEQARSSDGRAAAAGGGRATNRGGRGRVKWGSGYFFFNFIGAHNMPYFMPLLGCHKGCFNTFART